MTDIPEADVPPQKRACLTTLALGFKVGESSAARAARQPGPTQSDLRRYRGVDQRVTEIDTTVKQRTDEFEIRFEEAQDDRTFLRSRVNTLFRDRPDHRHTTMLLDREAMYAREMSSLQTQLTTTHGRIEILEARDPEPREGPTEEEIEFATEMMDKKMPTHTERQAVHKRKFDDTLRNNQHQQQLFKWNNVARAYTARPGDKKPYRGTKRLCPKCNYHHDGTCAPKCTNCKKIGHLARDCKGRPAATNNNTTTTTTNNPNNNNQRAQRANARGITCFECGVQGHYKSDCPKLKNGNQGNRTRNGNDVAKVYAVGTAGTNPNSNVVTDLCYDVELADDTIIWVNTLIRDCTSNFLNHPFNIDLMPVEMGSFDVIIGVDWLVKYHAVIVCDEKLVRVPFTPGTGRSTVFLNWDRVKGLGFVHF
uniref:CCHC-type domain-containing protein n=1 Tax=Tanacetum cinerariifolium TaxID=118510 RepID=A0A6L2MZA8_TANCI|nr:hypothetical protein [Tanacetum cinerariifolium]